MRGLATHAGAAVLGGQSDERLVELARAGGVGAFEAIVRRYRKPLIRHCSRMLPPARAEDAVQQAFMRAFKGIRDGDYDIKLRPWLYRIAHNCALNALREGGWDHAELDEEVDGVERPPEAAARRERVGELVTAINGLPERQRRAIVLREFEGRSYGEISDVLDVSDGAVRMLLTRARSALRRAVSVVTPPGLLLKLEAVGDGGLPQRIAETGGGVLAVKLTAGVLTATTLFAGGQLLVRSAHGGGRARPESSAADRGAVPQTPRIADAAPVRGAAQPPIANPEFRRSAVPVAGGHAPRPQPIFVRMRGGGASETLQRGGAPSGQGHRDGAASTSGNSGEGERVPAPVTGAPGGGGADPTHGSDGSASGSGGQPGGGDHSTRDSQADPSQTQSGDGGRRGGSDINGG